MHTKPGVNNSTRPLAFASKRLCRASKVLKFVLYFSNLQHLGEKLGHKGRVTYLEILTLKTYVFVDSI